MAITENGSPDTWGIEGYGGTDSSDIVWKNLSPYLKVSKNCGYDKGCIFEGMYKSVKGTDYGNFNNLADRYKVVLANGTSLMINTNNVSSSGVYLIQFYVDLNGSSKPNA